MSVIVFITCSSSDILFPIGRQLSCMCVRVLYFSPGVQLSAGLERSFRGAAELRPAGLRSYLYRWSLPTAWGVYRSARTCCFLSSCILFLSSVFTFVLRLFPGLGCIPFGRKYYTIRYSSNSGLRSVTVMVCLVLRGGIVDTGRTYGIHKNLPGIY